MITQAPKREFTLNFPISIVKNTIENSVRLRGKNLISKNELLNTYQISVLEGIYIIKIAIQLTDVETDKTKASFEGYSFSHSLIQPSMILTLMDKYLELFTNILEGRTVVRDLNSEEIEAKRIKEGRQKAIMIAVIVIALAIIGYGYLKNYKETQKYDEGIKQETK